MYEPWNVRKHNPAGGLCEFSEVWCVFKHQPASSMTSLLTKNSRVRNSQFSMKKGGNLLFGRYMYYHQSCKRSWSWSHKKILIDLDHDLDRDLDHHWWSLIFDLLILPIDLTIRSWSWSMIFDLFVLKDQRLRSWIIDITIVYDQFMAYLCESKQ